MIEIAPKALRFARLAAGGQAAFAGDPQVSTLRREEDASCLEQFGDNSLYVMISAEMARFCVQVFAKSLEERTRFQGANWDGDYLAFMCAVRDARAQQQLVQ